MVLRSAGKAWLAPFPCFCSNFLLALAFNVFPMGLAQAIYPGNPIRSGLGRLWESIEIAWCPALFIKWTDWSLFSSPSSFAYACSFIYILPNYVSGGWSLTAFSLFLRIQVVTHGLGQQNFPPLPLFSVSRAICIRLQTTPHLLFQESFLIPTTLLLFL